MFKQLMLVLSLVISFGFGSTMAQGTPAAEIDLDNDDFGDLPGIQAGWSRLWLVESGGATATPGSIRMFTLGALEFDTENHASQVYDAMVASIESDDATSLIDSPQFGDRSFSFTAEGSMMSANSVILVVQDGSVLFLLNETGEDVSADRVQDVAAHVMEAEMGPDPVKFSEDGGSTGGVYDRFPPADSEIFTGFDVVRDVNILTVD